MKKIFRIFRRDLNKIFKNAMAIILVVGVAVLPSLYAWFNIYANWDPYGSTGNMMVAVINEDSGAEIKDFHVCVGNSIVSNLKANDTINWQFLSKDEALEGVKAGKYYAAIEIPKDFSNSLTSILTPDFVQPNIIYYANEKKNAIATKITDKVASTVQTQVNESFVTTVIDVLNQVFGLVADEADIIDGNVFNKLSDEIASTKAGIEQVNTSLSGFSDIMELTEELNSTMSSEKLSSFLNHTDDVIENTSDAITVTENTLSGVVDIVSSAISDTSLLLDSLSDDIQNYKPNSSSTQALREAKEKCEAVSSRIDTVSTILIKLNESVPRPIEAVTRMLQQLDHIKSILDNISKNIDSLLNGGAASISEISASAANASSIMKGINSDFSENVNPQLKTMISSLLVSLDDASGMISLLNEDIPTIELLIKALNTSFASGNSMIGSVQNLTSEFLAQLDVLSDKLDILKNSEEFNTFVNLLSGNSSDLGAFVACPVQIETDKVYGIDNYGSAMAPFYSTLAFWVGGVILVAILKTNVKNKKELGGIKSYQEYFGRGLLFLMLAFIQGLIICLGDLYFLGIQCYHPAEFILAGCLASLVYSFLIYSLTVTFGDIGKAIAVILLVIQIGGSGGTFPIDVTPTFFRAINPYLPFTFVIDAMRECVCGTYSSDYWINLLKLCAYIPVALIIGLIIRIPFKKPIHFFNKKIEETDVL